MRCSTGLKKAPRERFALSEAEVLRRTHTPDDDRVRAAANFRLGQFLNEAGRGVAAVKYLDDAQRLRPDSWDYRRQAFTQRPHQSARGGGPEFWNAVDALGKESPTPTTDDI
jgi:hypothetical protein